MPGTVTNPKFSRTHAVDTPQLICVHKSTGCLFQESAPCINVGA